MWKSDHSNSMKKRASADRFRSSHPLPPIVSKRDLQDMLREAVENTASQTKPEEE